MNNHLMIKVLFVLAATGMVSMVKGQEATAPNSQKVEIANSLGIVTLKNGCSMTADDTIKLYNDDQTLWHAFSYYYDDSDGKYDFKNEHFRPFAFHPDYFTLGLIAKEKVSKNTYKVEVNQNTGEEKLLRLPPYLMLQSWEEHILNAYAIQFNAATNSPKAQPKANAQSRELPNLASYQPIGIKGDWLQLKWKKGDTFEYGWVKWQEGGFLCIMLFYMS